MFSITMPLNAARYWISRFSSRSASSGLVARRQLRRFADLGEVAQDPERVERQALAHGFALRRTLPSTVARPSRHSGSNSIVPELALRRPRGLPASRDGRGARTSASARSASTRRARATRCCASSPSRRRAGSRGCAAAARCLRRARCSGRARTDCRPARLGSSRPPRCRR